MVIYGIATQTSIGKLLIAGVVPGILVGVFLCAMIYVWVLIAPHHAPEAFRDAAGGALGQPRPGLAEPAADRARAGHALHRRRDADRGRRARRAARRRDRRGVRPAQLRGLPSMR